MPTPKKRNRLTWKQHKQNWSKCDRCLLAERRRFIVLYRGSIPCDVLFIGEAPGKSEDRLGKPFIGKAGKLMDQIVEAAFQEYTYTKGFSNIIACIPKEDDGNKVANSKDIPKEAIKGCSDRVDELIEMARPKGIVWVGGFAAKHGPRLETEHLPQCDIVHPAAILRADYANQTLPMQQSIVSIRDLLEEL